MYGNELTHYGVLGMKWGRRKGTTTSTSSGGRRTSSKSSETKGGDNQGVTVKKRVAEAPKQKKEKRQDKIDNDLNKMSDKQLRERINRIQMEQQYTRMMTPEKSWARKEAESFIYQEGKALASTIVRSEIRRALGGRYK